MTEKGRKMNGGEATNYFLTNLIPIYRARLQQIRNRARRLCVDLVNEVVNNTIKYSADLLSSTSTEQTREYQQAWHNYLGEVYKVDHNNFDSYKEIANIVQSAFSYSASHDLHSSGSGGTMLGLIEDVLFELKEDLGTDYTALTGRWWDGLAAKRKKQNLKQAVRAYNNKRKQKKEGEANIHDE